MAPLLRFDVPAMTGREIRSARLELYASRRSNSGGMTLSAYQVLRPWISNQTTWAQASRDAAWNLGGCNGEGTDRDAASSGTISVDAIGKWYSLDVTEMVRAWAADVTQNQGVIVKGGGTTSVQYDFASSESDDATLRPRLVVEAVLVPTETPTQTPTQTPVPTATETPVPTATETPVSTATETPMATATETSVPTATETPVLTATETPVSTATETPMATETPVSMATGTPVPMATETPVPTATETPVPTATELPMATETSVPMATGTPVPMATETQAPAATETPMPAATETPVPMATDTPVPLATETQAPTASKTPMPAATETPVPMATETQVPTATETPMPAATETLVPTATETPVPPTPTPVPPAATATPGPYAAMTASPTAARAIPIPPAETSTPPTVPAESPTATIAPTSAPIVEPTAPSITGNQPPVVDAGPDQTISQGEAAQLRGSVVDDGRTSSQAVVEAEWAQMSGPGLVTFEDLSAPYTTARLPEAGPYTLRLTADDGELQASDDVKITVDGTGGAVTTVEYRVKAKTDDAEERPTGVIFVLNTELDLAYNRGEQAVGLRFSGVNIPKGAKIVAATVQFKAGRRSSGDCLLSIAAEATDNAQPFVYRRSDISSRPSTTATVQWSPPPWLKGAMGPDQRTPDLSPVIQEVVDREGWSMGNGIAIIITGDGRRMAVSYNGDPAEAPLLHIEYALSAK
jgi:hypothetical protein